MHDSDADNDNVPPPGAKQVSSQKVVLADLYRQYWHSLCSYIRMQFGSGPPDPEDIAQQVFEKLGDLDRPVELKSPKAFLTRIAHNIVISEKRRLAVRAKHAEAVRHESSETRGYDLTPERVFIAREQFAMVKDVIAHMPRKRRRMLLLNRIHGLSYAEIARRFGISDAAVKKHVYKALSELDMALDSENGHPES